MDINKLWLSGTVVSNPTLERYGKSTPVSKFILKVKEKFNNKRGKDQFHENFFIIESLGRSTEKVMDTVKKGSRQMVDGYMRHDKKGNIDSIRARTFAVYPDESLDSHNYLSGLTQALTILDGSMDIESAKEKIAELIRLS